MNDLYLAHHGVLKQKWGVRRYQNPDGSLTEEGYRHYGYGKRGKQPGASPNTKQRIRQGAKLGVKVGLGVGALNAGLTIGSLATKAAVLGGTLNPAGAVILGASYLGTYAVSGLINGTVYGGIAGGVETIQGQKYIDGNETANKKMKEIFEKDEK